MSAAAWLAPVLERVRVMCIARVGRGRGQELFHDVTVKLLEDRHRLLSWMPPDMPGGWPSDEHDELARGTVYDDRCDDVDDWHRRIINTAREIARQLGRQRKQKAFDASHAGVDDIDEHSPLANVEDDLIAEIDARRKGPPDPADFWWSRFRLWVRASASIFDGEPARRARAYVLANKRCPRAFVPPIPPTSAPEAAELAVRTWEMLREREKKRVQRLSPRKVTKPPLAS